MHKSGLPVIRFTIGWKIPSENASFQLERINGETQLFFSILKSLERKFLGMGEENNYSLGVGFTFYLVFIRSKELTTVSGTW